MVLSLCPWVLLAAAAPAAVWTPLPKGTIALPHGGVVASLLFLPDGKTLISAGGDGSIRLWDPATGKERRRLEAPFGAAVISLALSPDGKRLASGGDDGTVRLWDLADGQSVRVVHKQHYAVTSLAFSPGGTQLASADGIRLRFSVM